MNLCKRACLYSIRKKGKTFTLLAFLMVMATLMLTCLSIQSATETANANIKKALLGYFTINAKTLENGIPAVSYTHLSAIAAQAQILLFDEPTSGLDYRHMREVAELLKRLAAEGKTI